MFNAGFIVRTCPLRNRQHHKIQDSNTFARLVSDVASVSDFPSIESVTDLGSVGDDEGDIALEEEISANADDIV